MCATGIRTWAARSVLPVIYSATHRPTIVIASELTGKYSTKIFEYDMHNKLININLVKFICKIQKTGVKTYFVAVNMFCIPEQGIKKATMR
jgi:hypothetical protein